MENVVALIETISGFIWGGTWGDTRILPVGPLAIVLLGTGIFMMIRLGGRPLRRFVPALKEVWDGRKAQGEDGAITPWQALSTALSGQVGTGNLAGVATAITLGGPGAIFWMWVVALFGMALAFSESSLALKYRETDEYGRINGGPMYYIKNGLGKHWGWLAVIFCLGTLFSATATGSMIQANSITEAALEVGSASFGISIPNWVVGVILSGLVFAVIIGGIKSIGSVAGKVVPVMAALYVAIAFLVLVLNAPKVPGAFMEIIYSAFGWKEVFGGAAGYGVLAAVRAGIARGLFSNEAGQGSAPIAHAAAQTKNPVMQGEIAMIGVFIDTIVICTMTALVILTVTGDFEKSPSLMAANYCDDQGIVLPLDPSQDGVRYGVGDLVPSAYEDGRAETIAANGQTAQAYLASCRAGGVTFDGLFKWSDTTRGDLRAAKKAHAASGADTAFSVLGVESAAAEEEAFYQAALAGAMDPDVKIKVDHAWETDANSAAITTRAYGAALPGGEWIVPIALFFFAFTTIIGWSYYGEQALTYLVGEWATHPFRYAWVLVVFAGTLVTNTDALWLLGDIANASMAFPNLIAILALSGVVIAMHKSNGEDEDATVVSDKSTTDGAE
ncbi:MAG: sodium:alanine symporter family protein [Pseudomonadota bacterium]